MAKILYKLMVEIFYVPFVILIFIRKFFGKEDKFKFKEKIFPNKKINRPKVLCFGFTQQV